MSANQQPVIARTGQPGRYDTIRDNNAVCPPEGIDMLILKLKQPI